MRIGLLGGSFNPAHAGHRHVATLARRRLRLNQVWLMVSPGNPLKPRAGMAPFAHRLASARRFADGRRILASGIESVFGTRFTVDTLRLLRRRFPRVSFIWIIGADILSELHRWRRWGEIARHHPFAVLPRPGYTLRALAGRAARQMHRTRHPSRMAPALAGQAPGWAFLPERENALSATALRQAGKGAVP